MKCYTILVLALAYTKVPKSVDKIACKYKISVATCRDAEALLTLIKESEQFYIESPIFLKRGNYEFICSNRI